MTFSCPKKEIVYRGGLVRFFIPKSWNEEYEESGGGTFYETGEDTGTLRLNVLSFEMKKDTSPEELLEMVKRRKTENRAHLEVLSDERFLLKYAVKAREDEEDLVIFRWEIAKMVSSRDYNIAAFSFTITAVQSKLESFRQEIASIEEDIKNVRNQVKAEAFSDGGPKNDFAMATNHNFVYTPLLLRIPQ